MLEQLIEQSRWLSHHASDITSQAGEDGIIAKALSLLPHQTFWCVEFGAWDGKQISNTYELIESHDYRGVFIEADANKFRDLERTHGSSGKHVLVNAFVGFTKADSLDVLLSKCDIPAQFDLLSIDIDGNDYHVWEAVENYRPSLVVIEFNPTISNSIHYVQKKDNSVSQGSSPASLVELAKRKGYELVAVTFVNLIFVVAEYYEAFGIKDNSLTVMRDDSKVPQVFVGYDGHVFLSEAGESGFITLPWHHRLKLKERNVQVLPKRLQKYPERYSMVERLQWYAKFGLQQPRLAMRRLLHPANRRRINTPYL